MKHPNTVEIIVGPLTPVNIKRAIGVADALDLGGARSSMNWLERDHDKTRDVFVAWLGGPGSDYSRHGYVGEDGDCKDGTVIDLRKIPRPGVKLQLNEEYTAEVSQDGKSVKVGCQTIVADKVLELAKMIEEARK